MKKEVKEKKEVEKKADVNEVAYTVRKVIKVLEDVFGVDIDRDGKVGSASLGNILVGGLIAFLILASPLFAGEIVVDRLDAPEGSDAVLEINADERDDSADVGELIMTTSGTMTIDVGGTTAATFSSSGISASTTGDVTCDDITASGADTASLDVNIPASTNAQMGTITVKSATAVSELTDADYLQFVLLNMYNSATSAVNYAYMRAVADDVTTATEDGAIEFYVEINSTATKALDIDATGIDAGAGSVSGTGMDAGDGNIANVGDIAVDSISSDGSAITVVNEALTFTNNTVTATGSTFSNGTYYADALYGSGALQGITTNYSGVTNFDIVITDGLITTFTVN